MKRLTLALVAGLLAAACQRSDEPYLIATAGPWDQGYGAMNRRGIDLAIEEINRAGGVNGRPLQLIAFNDSGDGSKAARIAAELVDSARVLAVVGHVNSGAMVSAARVYDGRLAAVSTTASTPDLSGISSWAFRVISSDSVNGQDMARFSAALGHRRAAILYENNPYGRGLTEAFRRGWKGEIVSVDPIADDDTNFEPYISFLQRRAPDIVFVAGTEVSALGVLREARRQNFRAAFLGGDGWTGIVADTAAAEGAYVAAPFSAQDPRREAQEFVRAFRARYGGLEPDGNSALAYDATRLVARAIERGGGTRAGVRDWLASTDRGEPFRGVTGDIKFDSSGDVQGKGFVFTRVRKGSLLVEAQQPGGSR